MLYVILLIIGIKILFPPISWGLQSVGGNSPWQSALCMSIDLHDVSFSAAVNVVAIASYSVQIS